MKRPKPRKRTDRQPKVRKRAPGAGRPPKPTALHVLHGTQPENSTGAAEPLPDLVGPDDLVVPDWLDKYGQEFWSRHAPHLARLKLLTVVDLDLFAAACERWATYRRAAQWLPLEDCLDTKTIAAFGVARRSLDQCKAILVQFGIGPAARSRTAAQVQDSKPVDPAEEWMKRHAAG